MMFKTLQKTHVKILDRKRYCEINAQVTDNYNDNSIPYKAQDEKQNKNKSRKTCKNDEYVKWGYGEYIFSYIYMAWTQTSLIICPKMPIC